jgi:hypothetical protein
MLPSELQVSDVEFNDICKLSGCSTFTEPEIVLPPKPVTVTEYVEADRKDKSSIVSLKPALLSQK